MMLRVSILFGLLACAYADDGSVAVEFETGGFMTIKFGCDEHQAKENENLRPMKHDGLDHIVKFDKNDVLTSLHEFCPGFTANLTGRVLIDTPVKFGILVDPTCKPLGSRVPVGQVSAVKDAELPGSGLTSTTLIDVTGHVEGSLGTSGVWGDDTDMCDPGCLHILLGKSTDADLQVINVIEFLRGGVCTMPVDLNVVVTYTAGTTPAGSTVALGEDEHGVFFPLRALVNSVGVQVDNGPLPPTNPEDPDSVLIYFTQREFAGCDKGEDIRIDDTVLFEAKLGDWNSWHSDDIPEKVRIGSADNQSCAFCGHGRIVILWDYLHSRRGDADRCDNYKTIEVDVECIDAAHAVKKTECFPSFWDQGATAWCGICEGPYSKKLVKVEGGRDKMRWTPFHDMDWVEAMGVARIWQMQKRYMYPEVCIHVQDTDAKLTYMKDTPTPVTEACKVAVMHAMQSYHVDNNMDVDQFDAAIVACAGAGDGFVAKLLSGYKAYLHFANIHDTLSEEERITETAKLYLGDFDPTKKVCPSNFGNWEEDAELLGELVARLVHEDGDAWHELPRSVCAYRMSALKMMSARNLLVAPDLMAELKRRKDEDEERKAHINYIVEHLKTHVGMDYEFLHDCDVKFSFRPKMIAPTYTYAKGNDIMRGFMSYYEAGRYNMNLVGVFHNVPQACVDHTMDPGQDHGNGTMPDPPPTRK